MSEQGGEYFWTRHYLTEPPLQMISFIDLHSDILLAIAPYIGIFDLLNLALTCRLTFQLSDLISYWNTDGAELPLQLCAFLPHRRYGPWTSFTGGEIRRAVLSLRRYHYTWENGVEVPGYLGPELLIPAKRVVELPHVGDEEQSLMTVYEIKDSPILLIYDNSHKPRTVTVDFCDARTGEVTKDCFRWDTEGEIGWNPPSPCARALEPNRILVVVTHPYNPLEWRFINFELDYMARHPSAGDLRARYSLIHTVSVGTMDHMIYLGRKFYINRRDRLMLQPEFQIGHLPSGRVWTWDPWGFRDLQASDEWLLVVTERVDGSIYGSAIHLPSFFRLPPPVDTRLEDLVDANQTHRLFTSSFNDPHGRNIGNSIRVLAKPKQINDLNDSRNCETETMLIELWLPTHPTTYLTTEVHLSEVYDSIWGNISHSTDLHTYSEPPSIYATVAEAFASEECLASLPKQYQGNVSGLEATGQHEIRAIRQHHPEAYHLHTYELSIFQDVRPDSYLHHIRDEEPFGTDKKRILGWKMEREGKEEGQIPGEEEKPTRFIGVCHQSHEMGSFVITLYSGDHKDGTQAVPVYRVVWL